MTNPGSTVIDFRTGPILLLYSQWDIAKSSGRKKGRVLPVEREEMSGHLLSFSSILFSHIQVQFCHLLKYYITTDPRKICHNCQWVEYDPEFAWELPIGNFSHNGERKPIYLMKGMDFLTVVS